MDSILLYLCLLLVSGRVFGRPSPDEGYRPPEEAPPMPYSFAYAVAAPDTGDFKGHEQTMNNQGHTSGSYYVLSPDGIWRQTIFSDVGFGYEARIEESPEDSPPSQVSQKTFSVYYNQGQNAEDVAERMGKLVGRPITPFRPLSTSSRNDPGTNSISATSGRSRLVPEFSVVAESAEIISSEDIISSPLGGAARGAGAPGAIQGPFVSAEVNDLSREIIIQNPTPSRPLNVLPQLQARSQGPLGRDDSNSRALDVNAALPQTPANINQITGGAPLPISQPPPQTQTQTQSHTQPQTPQPQVPQLQAPQPQAPQPQAPQPQAPQPQAPQPQAPQPQAPQPQAPQPQAPQPQAPQPQATQPQVPQPQAPQLQVPQPQAPQPQAPQPQVPQPQAPQPQAPQPQAPQPQAPQPQAPQPQAPQRQTPLPPLPPPPPQQQQQQQQPLAPVVSGNQVGVPLNLPPTPTRQNSGAPLTQQTGLSSIPASGVFIQQDSENLIQSPQGSGIPLDASRSNQAQQQNRQQQPRRQQINKNVVAGVPLNQARSQAPVVNSANQGRVAPAQSSAPALQPRRPSNNFIILQSAEVFDNELEFDEDLFRRQQFLNPRSQAVPGRQTSGRGTERALNTRNRVQSFASVPLPLNLRGNVAARNQGNSARFFISA